MVALRTLRLGALAVLAAVAPVARGGAQSTQSARGSRLPLNVPIVLDSFDDVRAWKAVPSDGVSLRLAEDAGVRGRAMRLDFDFHGGGGYAVAHRDLPVDLPDNYEISFWIRGRAPSNTVEFKLIDSTGENVWWVDRRDYVFPEHWTRFVIKKRQISFAWGPRGGGELRHAAAVEIAITAGSGGKGSVWLDELTLTPRAVPALHPPAPRATASNSARGADAALAVDGRAATEWHSGADSAAWLALDLGTEREYGGLTIDWDPRDHARDYLVETSDDGRAWTVAYHARNARGGRSEIYMPETDSRWVRLALRASSSGHGFGIREITIRPLAWSASMNAFDFAIAKDAPRGDFPRAFTDSVQTYWTVIGAPAAEREALVSEDGAVEIGKSEMSLEPFLYSNGRLTSWADVEPVQSLERGDLPIPSVHWKSRDTEQPLSLTTTAWVAGPGDSAVLVMRYRVENAGATARHATLFVAERPFQVNGPFQFLNTPGGAARLSDISYDGHTVRVVTGQAGSVERIVPVTRPGAFGAASFDEGGVLRALRAGTVPASSHATDSLGRAGGALSYALDVPASDHRDVIITVPFGKGAAWRADADPTTLAAESLERTRREWAAREDNVRIHLPPAADRLARTLRTMQAYILINQDGPKIQPGSRSYERSWIRDGALTSEALLRTGHTDRVAAFLEWYAPYQYPNGKVPCCVDRRGADPVPEHDSDGELLYLVHQLYRYTGDRAMLERMWPHVVRGVSYLDSLCRSERTPAYQTPANRMFYGLLPPSISHEGYSAKPMHSYWDDFWALRGYKDATAIARALGRADSTRFAASTNEFRGDLLRSIAASMRAHHIDYIPGSADLGDFDATSTTIALDPGGEQSSLPPEALEHTFERFWRSHLERVSGRVKWDAYTPYEWRIVGSMVRLGHPERAHALIDFLMQGARPPTWNEWAEVVGREARVPRFIGDMPHTWVGSDFTRSLLDLFVYERESDAALVAAAGIPDTWVRAPGGVDVQGVRTPYGRLDLSARSLGAATRITLGGGLTVPPGGVVVHAPFPRVPRRVIVNGAAGRLDTGGTVTVRSLPATVDFFY